VRPARPREPNEDGKAKQWTAASVLATLLPRHRCRRADRQGRDRRSPRIRCRRDAVTCAGVPPPTADPAVRRRAAAGDAAVRPLGRSTARPAAAGRFLAWRGRGGGPRRAGATSPVPDRTWGGARTCPRRRARRRARALRPRLVHTRRARPDDSTPVPSRRHPGRDEPAGRSTSPTTRSRLARRRSRQAALTLVWGSATHGGAVATAELAEVTVDQCELIENRLTLIAPIAIPPDRRAPVALFNARGVELARESAATRRTATTRTTRGGRGAYPPDTLHRVTGSADGQVGRLAVPDRSRSPTATGCGRRLRRPAAEIPSHRPRRSCSRSRCGPCSGWSRPRLVPAAWPILVGREAVAAAAAPAGVSE